MNNLKIKFFTYEEAEKLLPEIKTLTKQISRTKRKLVNGLIDIGRIKNRVSRNGDIEKLGEKIEEIYFLQEILSGYYRDLLAEGLIIRSLNEVSLDFPTIIQGDVAYFCWKDGDETICTWHRINREEREAITGDLKLLELSPDTITEK